MLAARHFQLLRYKGYSLIELIITITLLSIVMTIFFTFMQNQLQSVNPVTQVKAAQLAQAYLEEISLKRYDENSPIGNRQRCNAPSSPNLCSGTLGADGETRNLFDDIDDFDGLTDNQPVDAQGNVRAGFSGFSVNVSVVYAGSDFGLAAQDLKRIEVTVNGPQGGIFLFSQYKGNF